MRIDLHVKLNKLSNIEIFRPMHVIVQYTLATDATCNHFYMIEETLNYIYPWPQTATKLHQSAISITS
jgi:hypothetical protein